jgi:S-DNA-T family DNA segregation ATPase FtsK/SpoIIIE
MTERISVTEVRNALRCPRLFALGRMLGQSVAFPVGSSCLGATFHRIVERLSRVAAEPPRRFAQLPAGAARDEVQARLADWLLDLLIEELSADASYASMPGEVDDLAEALRELARHLAARLVVLPEPAPLALQRLLHSGEQEIEATLGEGGPLVSGRLDALFADGQGALEVVEYKLTDEANDELDRAQVGLYRALLKAARGVDARPLILRFSPTLRELPLAAEASDAFLQTRVLPVVHAMSEWARDLGCVPATRREDLCAACPVASACKANYPERLAVRDDPPMTALRPRPGPVSGLSDVVVWDAGAARADDAEGQREAEALKERILTELKREGALAVCPRPPIVGPTLYQIEVSRPRGAVRHLDRAADDVRHRLAAEDGVDVEYQKSGGHRHFIVRRKHPKSVLLAPLLAARRVFLAARAGRFIVGQCPDGDILCGDFSDSSTPHLLVAGQTGSGKSVFLQSVIASLVQYHPPSAIRFTLVDPKRVTFNAVAFRGAVAAHLDGPVRFDVEEVLPVLEQLIELMEERYGLFAAARVTDIGEFNEQSSSAEQLERRLLVIDEFQDLISDKATKERFFAAIKRLGAKSRAAGIHLVLATQRPDRDVVPPIVKANLGGKIALQVASKVNSRIVLDEAGAEALLGKGDLLANLGRGLVRAQAAMLSGR